MVKPNVTVTDWRTYTFQVDLAVDLRMRGLCASPYPGHRQGCPKFNTGNPNCPPDAYKVFDFYDRRSNFLVVINEFNIKQHLQQLAVAHPAWSDRQLRCCLYWQPAARKQLYQKVNYVLAQKEFAGYISTMCPEAMGIDVTETMKRIGIILEWPPVQISRQIALLGRPISSTYEQGIQSLHLVASSTSTLA